MNFLDFTLRGALLCRISLRAPVAVVSLGAFLAVSSATAAQPKDVTLDEPIAVEVEGVVEVLGAVDVLSEPKRIRYVQAQRAVIAIDEDSATVTFSIPEGKMLVVETVTVLGNAPVGALAFGWLNLSEKTAGAPTAIVPLLMSDRGLFDGDRLLMLTEPVKLRIDSSQNELKARMQRSPEGDGASFNIYVFGYLEDL
jgi:hypothetical protein